jgi:hypothetical protein
MKQKQSDTYLNLAFMVSSEIEQIHVKKKSMRNGCYTNDVCKSMTIYFMQLTIT